MTFGLRAAERYDHVLPYRRTLTPTIGIYVMKKIVAAFIICLIASTAIANLSTPRPLSGKWTWTYAKNNCTELYDFRPDNTSIVTSGEEISESHFTISDQPDSNGFYRMTDVVTKSNGRTGCDGSPGGTPVGDTATIYIFFHPTRNEMVMCEEASFNACMGPLQCISK